MKHQINIYEFVKISKKKFTKKLQLYTAKSRFVMKGKEGLRLLSCISNTPVVVLNWDIRFFKRAGAKTKRGHMMAGVLL